MPETQNQNEITLAVIGVKLENISIQLKQNENDHLLLKETLRWQEEKRCKKNDLILATFNQNNGKLEEKIDALKEKVITREQFDRHLESQTGRNMMLQKDIKENCDSIESLEKEQIKVDGKIKNILIYFSIIGTAIIIAIDIARKRLGI